MSFDNHMMETENVCVKEESVVPEPFEVVLFSVKKEFESEDDAVGEWAASCTGDALAPVETAASSRVVGKDEITIVDGLGCDKLGAPVTYTGLPKVTELQCTEEERHENETRLSKYLNNNDCFFESAKFEYSNLSLDKKHKEAQSINDKCKPSIVAKENSVAHSGEKCFLCPQCGSKFHKKYVLNRHIRSHTGEKPFSCTLCSAKFITKQKISRHMTSHTGEKPFACALCSAKFSNKWCISSHMTTHTGEKPFSCALCSAKFSRKGSMYRHMTTHTGEKPFSCALCSAKFLWQIDLSRHMTTHTGEKPFSCALCSAKFSRKGTMAVHMTTHTGEKPFSCELCSAKFITKQTLSKHLTKHTQDGPM
ncbi:gastrula zinc finger protein xLCGF3.1-like isoform X7 [Bacillus rossius redtenbacheri]|uniref:gastrula zinc finger protein xLCGF3.1-like isoform X7 n=2 Tax=Bacillus rossius redtenbacheri TaxID=93214 RepID=UPI002FDD8D66